MKYTKKAIAALSAATVIGAAGIGATTMAVTSDSSSDYPPIVKKIAEAFNLDPAKVNNVFTQQREENQQARQEKLQARLDQAVKDGKLTKDQADKLLAKLKSLHEEFKSGSYEDHRQNRQDFKDQLETWAKANDIDNLDEILPHPGGRHHHGFMHSKVEDN